MDQNEENELLRITQNTDTFSCEVMGNLYFLMKDRPDILKSHPQMTAMIKRRYSEIVDYPLPSTLCLNPAGAPILLVPLDNIEGYLYTELRKGHLDGWKAQEKATYPQRKFSLGLKDNAHFTPCEYIRKYSAKRIFRNNGDVWIKTA